MKYIEERYPRYFIFGESKDGTRVDIASSEDSTIATVSRDEAYKLIQQRDEVVDKLSDTVLAFYKTNPEAFKRFWYGVA